MYDSLSYDTPLKQREMLAACLLDQASPNTGPYCSPLSLLDINYRGRASPAVQNTSPFEAPKNSSSHPASLLFFSVSYICSVSSFELILATLSVASRQVIENTL